MDESTYRYEAHGVNEYIPQYSKSRPHTIKRKRQHAEWPDRGTGQGNRDPGPVGNPALPAQ